MVGKFGRIQQWDSSGNGRPVRLLNHHTGVVRHAVKILDRHPRMMHAAPVRVEVDHSGSAGARYRVVQMMSVSVSTIAGSSLGSPRRTIW